MFIFIVIILFLLIIIILSTKRFHFYQIIDEKLFPETILNTKISHRGLFDQKIPENSLPAFKKAVQNKLPIELDVMTTKDNIPVVIHDPNLKRLTGVNQNIKDLTFEQLTKIKLNEKFNIPTFKQVLAEINGKVPLIVEIKKDKGFANQQEKEILKLLTKYEGEFIIQSFNPFVIHWLSKNYPNIIRGQLFSWPKYRNKFLIIFRDNLFNFIARPNYIAYNKSTIKKADLNQARQKGLKIIAWTIKTKSIDSIESKKYFDNVIFELKDK